MQFYYPPGATPLDADEMEGLIPIHITNQSELNEWEASNILEAEAWIFSTQHKNILTLDFLLQAHRKMFSRTWRWAGKFRKSDKNIGIGWEKIAIQAKLLLDDTEYQINNKVYEFDELAARFHHRLVAIHLFANGNGRHARIMTDVLLVNYNLQRFSWGSSNIYQDAEVRQHYITALRAADKHEYRLLIQFVRSNQSRL